MKFIVSSSLLLKQLQILSGVISNNNASPILDNFLFDLEENKLSISASDLETTIISTIEVDSDNSGMVAIPSRLLLDALKTFPDQPLTFRVEKESVEIISDQGKYNMACFNAEEFPKIASLTGTGITTIPADVLSKAISKTIFAAGNDDLRPIMNGVLFEFSPEGITFVATDSHRLVKYTRTDITSEKDVRFIVPRKPLNLLKGVLASVEEQVDVEYNETNARFSYENMVLACRLIDGKYPNYQAVIPSENPNKLTLDRISFLNVVRRTAIFSSKTTHGIRLEMAGTELNVFAEDLDFSNKATERLSCDYQGDDMVIGFNSRFLAEMLSYLNSDNILIEMSLPNRASILTQIDDDQDNEQILMLVMPVGVG